jgi:signal transduction histidine kinase
MRRTFNEFVYLTSGLVAATAWFGLLLAGWLAVGLLAVTPLVVPVLIAFRWATRGFALAEAAVARELLGNGTRVAPAAAGERGYLNRVRGVLGDGAFWRQQAFGALRVLPGFAAGIAVVSAVASSLFLVSLPVTYRWVDMWQVHTIGRAFAAVPVGLLALAVSGALVHALGRGWAAMTPALLGAEPVGGAEPRQLSRRRTGLREHAAAYLAINGLSIVVWALTTRAYFWAEWPLLALAVPLALHAIGVRSVEVARPRRAVAVHAAVAATLTVFLIAVWAVTTRGYFWPMWPILAFVLLVGAHALAVRRGSDRTQLEERIGVLETTRAGAIEAAEDDLRRIERDLHDGAQARLVALGMSLGLAQQRLAEDPEAAKQLLAEARAGAEEALRELRSLARGIHPPVLTDRGLEAALAALVARIPLPVELDVDLSGRPAPAQETAAYFVAAEALANASKHARASRIAVRIAEQREALVVRVEDDGRGGADARGGGLSGLSRRVEALDGTMRVTSPPGGPTIVEAVLPCAP